MPKATWTQEACPTGSRSTSSARNDAESSAGSPTCDGGERTSLRTQQVITNRACLVRAGGHTACYAEMIGSWSRHRHCAGASVQAASIKAKRRGPRSPPQVSRSR